MERLVGVGASPGIAIGVAHVLASRVDIHERRIAADQVEAEIQRFEKALHDTDEQLARIQTQLAATEGDDHQYRILEAHRLMLSDVHLVERARRIIREETTAAEWAVRKALDQIQAVFEKIEDPYFRDRKSDVALVGERLLRTLVGRRESTSAEDAPKGSIAVAHELSPADAAQLGRAEAAGFCTEGGGRTSHTAIVARALGLPYVVGVEGLGHKVWSGMTMVIDGFRGEVILDPDAEALRRYEARADVHRARSQRLAAIRDVPSQTTDGTVVHLHANVEMLEEIPIAVDLGAESVGLFRTEFLYLERSELPSEEEQYAHAVAALRSVGGRTITFRTLDLGGDKLPPSVRMPMGTNPAMGLRSIRYSLRRPDVFSTQLRALHRAAAVGPMQILLPLISGVAELRATKQLCLQVVEDLQREGIPHVAKVPLGVMIETPSAALIADLLAAECDFLSIGTNDLIQYALAIDREDEHVGYLYHPLHPAILRAVRQTVVGAERMGKPVAMCGDMAGDPILAWVLMGLGLRNLSMAPRQIPVVKSIIRSTQIADAERLLAQALTMSTETEIEELVYGAMNRRFPLELTDGEEDRPAG
ncbi:MAG TPA: phosphoenolpyruvate--protein phosphotransferase [Polyangia bacterium]|jgi:phosphotransferase system enzyme I (PtsI)|nr:phosphoenolpyruvate--protein phosphotransferase [Polyangia bacterium]